LRFSSDLLEEIRNHCDIVDIISDYVPLKPAGRNFKGLCPFHEEKTPSFMVSPEKQLFHCFGCGEGGNIFTFITKYEKISFTEAVEILAKKSGIALPENEKKDNILQEKREKLYKINSLASMYFQRCLLKTERGKKVINYLEKRGIESGSVEKYKIGYAPAGWDSLNRFLTKNKFSQGEQAQVGLITQSKNKGRFIDYFRERIIFPIFNYQGKIIGFGGRVLRETLPKYINSPETLIYKKGNSLYNINFAKEHIRRNKRVIIVEGYTDVLIAQKYGFEEVVASLGTALTIKQIEILKRLTNSALIAYDSDLAGNMATLRSLDLMLKAGMEVKVINLPSGYDPADFIGKKGKEAFQSLVDNALSLVNYKLRQLCLKHGFQSVDSKVKIVKDILPTLKAIDSEIELREQIKKISEGLKISEEAILIELKRQKHGIREFSDNLFQFISEPGNVKSEKILIGCMLESRDIAAKIFNELKIEDFSIPLHREIVSSIKKQIIDKENIDSQTIIDSLDNINAVKLISRILIEETITFDEKIINGYINTIKKFKSLLEKKDLTKKAKLLDEKIKKTGKLEKKDREQLIEFLRELKK